MQRQILRYGGALLFAGAIALAGCSGDKGSVGPAGPTGDTGAAGPAGTNGTNGTDLTATAKPETCEVCHGGAGATHQGLYTAFTNGLNPATSKLVANVVGVASQDNGDGTFTSTLTFTASLNGVPLTAAQVGALKQKRFTATAYAADNTFTTDTAISYDTKTLADIAGNQITITAAKAAFAVEAPGTNAFVYLYLGDKILIPNEPTTAGRYNLLANVANAAKVYGAIGYTSAANVSGCEKCHPAPYSKHGYRQATVAGLPDFVACKACHTDQEPGTDFVFQVLADDPAAAAALTVDAAGETVYSAAQKAKYAYVATVLNDTHMSHAMEFTYPQSMANCVTCHEGKLDRILADSNFKLSTCKSCHPVSGTEGNAPPLTGPTGVMPAAIHTWSLYEPYTGMECSICHGSAPGHASSFAMIHSGYDLQIYKDAATKFSSVVTTKVDSAKFDKTTNKLTVAFSVAGADATALVKPTVVASLYGYGTKDFVVSGHNGQADGTRNLEWTEGAMQRGDPTKSANSPRLTVDPGTAAAGVKAWTATADLSLWASLISSGEVKQIELAVLPTLGRNQALAVSTTNPAIAIAGTSMTFDLVGNAIVTDAYGKGIVDAAKCNKCHGALGTTFHTPNYGSAGVVACRICHTVRDGGAHLEMQSRSIDSYIHAIHSFQAFDVGGIDFTDPVQAMEYEHHIGATYPNFTILNCESCHAAKNYEVPDQSKSLPSVLSAAATNATWNRAIGAFPMYVTGPASRACGSCHRSQMIKQDDAGALASFDQHASDMGYMLETTSKTASADLDAAIAKIFSVFAK